MINTGQGQGESQELARCRAIIMSACRMLVDSQASMTALGRELPYSAADCYVLLQDATRLHCQYVGEYYGEAETSRWTPALPEALLAHPDRCLQTLELVEAREFKGLAYLRIDAA